jgi:hypothetical protein
MKNVKLLAMLEEKGIVPETHYICIGGDCKTCKRNAVNTRRSYCAGDDCGWCHNPEVITIGKGSATTIVGTCKRCGGY